MMQRALFLLITAAGEGLTGLFLLLLPAVPLAALLGLSAVSPESLLLARVAGAAIIAIAISSGAARADAGGPALRAVLAGILVYDVTVAAVLVSADLRLGLNGVLLWPAVLAHAVLAIWCALCLRDGNASRGADRA